MVFIKSHSSSMSYYEIVSYNVWLSERVSNRTSKRFTTAPWCISPKRITQGTKTPWFIYCDPMFNSISKLLKTYFGIIPEIISGKEEQLADINAYSFYVIGQESVNELKVWRSCSPTNIHLVLFSGVH